LCDGRPIPESNAVCRSSALNRSLPPETSPVSCETSNSRTRCSSVTRNKPGAPSVNILDYGSVAFFPCEPTLAAREPHVAARSRGRRARKVAVHFDIDVLDPSLYDFLLFHDPFAAPGTYDEVPKGRMRFEEVAAILNAVAAKADIVGLAITEYMPWSAIRLSRSLRSLPLLGGG
jgi:hypothetical protein